MNVRDGLLVRRDESGAHHDNANSGGAKEGTTSIRNFQLSPVSLVGLPPLAECDVKEDGPPLDQARDDLAVEVRHDL